MSVLRLLLVSFFMWPAYGQVTLDAGLEALASGLSDSARGGTAQRIAVLPLQELDGQQTMLGLYIAEELVTRLVQTGRFQIVERHLLASVLGELKVQQSGMVDPATAKAIGRLAAAGAIVTGSITMFEREVAVHARLIDTSTGDIVAATTVRLAKDQAVEKLLGAGRAQSSAAPAVLATKDTGSLRVAIVSLSRVGRAVRLVLDLSNRDAQRVLAVALNAGPLQAPTGVSFGPRTVTTNLRSSLDDDRGMTWSANAEGVRGLGVVRAGTSATEGFWVEKHEFYDPSGIAGLLARWERTGSNIISGRGIFDGDTFVSGSVTELDPGGSRRVTIDFEPTQHDRREPVTFRAMLELVVGVGQAGRRSYALQQMYFDGLRSQNAEDE